MPCTVPEPKSQSTWCTTYLPSSETHILEGSLSHEHSGLKMVDCKLELKIEGRNEQIRQTHP